MPTDIWYGADCEVRIGRRANVATPPASWRSIEFMQMTINPTQEWRERAKLGVPGKRHNALDPIKPRKGFFRLTSELVLDGDTRQLPLWLRYGWGAPAAAVANGDLYDHVWSSGGKTEQYFDLQVKVATNRVWIYEGLTIASLSNQATAENTQDFDINISLRGLRRRKASAFEGGAPTDCPDEAPILRALYEVDGVAAANTLNSGFTYDRSLSEGLFLSPTPTVSSNRPGAAPAHTMTATFRAAAAEFDDIEVEETVFAAAIRYLGVAEDHEIRVEQANSMLQPSSLQIGGPAELERTFNSAGHQDSVTPATTITVTNDVATYASA